MRKHIFAFSLLALCTVWANSDCYNQLYQENQYFQEFEDSLSNLYGLEYHSPFDVYLFNMNELYKRLIDLKTKGTDLPSII